MIEAIQVIRDVVIIVSAVTITATVVIVGSAVLDLTRAVDGMRAGIANTVTAAVNPIRAGLLFLTRVGRRRV